MLRASLRSIAERRIHAFAALCVVGLVVGCAQNPTPSPTAQPDNTIAPPQAVSPAAPPAVAATPATGSASSPAAAVPSAAPTTPPAPGATASNVPRDPRKVATTEALTPSGVNRYQCVMPRDAAGTGTPIELPPNTLRVCSRFPAMGPCQYERSACRAKGGRVIRFDGVEIDKDVEREYDKQVQRFRLNAG